MMLAILLALGLASGHGSGAPAATASSTLRLLDRDRHDARQALDGSGATAWCEGEPGVGVGEWIEVRPRCPREKGICRLELENGWSRSPETYQQHGRVLRMRIAPCGGGNDGKIVEVKDTPESQELVLKEPLPWPACVRLTILHATAGTKTQDTCLSEVRAYCECHP